MALSSTLVPTSRQTGAGLSLDQSADSQASAADLQCQLELPDLECRIRAAAEAGAIAEAARLILKALDCERRQANRAPQILQLIKPRD